MTKNNFIYEIYKDNSDNLKVGDEIIYGNGELSEPVTSVSLYNINNRYSKSRVAFAPFKFNKDLTLDDSQLEILSKEINRQLLLKIDNHRKDFLSNCLEFIKTYKSICSKSFMFWLRVRDIEFIPKTKQHLETLMRAVQNFNYR